MAVQVGDKEFSELTPEVTAGFHTMIKKIDEVIMKAIKTDFTNTQDAITAKKKAFVEASKQLDTYHTMTKSHDTTWFTCLRDAGALICVCEDTCQNCTKCQKECKDTCGDVDPIYEWMLPNPHFGEKTCDLEIHDEPRDCPPLKALDDKTTAIGKDIAAHYAQWKLKNEKCIICTKNCDKTCKKCADCKEKVDFKLSSCDAKKEVFQQHGCKFGDLWKAKCGELKDFLGYVAPSYATYEKEKNANDGRGGVNQRSEPDRSWEWSSMMVVKCVILNYAPIKELKNVPDADKFVRKQTIKEWMKLEDDCAKQFALNDRDGRHKQYQVAIGKMNYYREEILKYNTGHLAGYPLPCTMGWPAGTFVDDWKTSIYVKFDTRTTKFHGQWYNLPGFSVSGDGLKRFGEPIKDQCPHKPKDKMWNYEIFRKVTETNREGLC